MKRPMIVLLSSLGLVAGTALAVGPAVSNVRASQRAGTKLVDVYYDLGDADSSLLTVSVAVSTNGGVSYSLPATSFTGALGAGIAPGSNQQIVWNAGADWNGEFSANVRFRVTASDDTAPSGMVLIPAGSFTMGDSLDGDALPLHSVYVSAFYMDKYDVTKALWDEVYNWAVAHGYSLGSAQGKGSNHPAHSMTWYSAVIWCNARSEMEGRIPAYYTSPAQTAVCRGLEVSYDNNSVNWSANGYRLPTEAEWEKAARGGQSGQRFPWGNTISWSQANYYTSPSGIAYDMNPTTGYHPTFNDGVAPYTSPVGYFAPNGYGLYDMAGNVSQWCWDAYGNYSSEPQSDPRGPSLPSFRSYRGGCWYFNALVCRTANREEYPAIGSTFFIGFRCVRSAVQ